MLAFVQDNMTCTAFLKKSQDQVIRNGLHVCGCTALQIWNWPLSRIAGGHHWGVTEQKSWNPPGGVRATRNHHQEWRIKAKDLTNPSSTSLFLAMISLNIRCTIVDSCPIRALIMVKDMICFVATKQKVQYIFSSWQTSPGWTYFTFFQNIFSRSSPHLWSSPLGLAGRSVYDLLYETSHRAE